jgi:hypothetical protein
MSKWSIGAAWWPRPRSLCTAAAAAWYVRAMYKHQCFAFLLVLGLVNDPSSHDSILFAFYAREREDLCHLQRLASQSLFTRHFQINKIFRT